MALRQRSDLKQTADRHETDYERWLKDHDHSYEPGVVPQYHPSDAENTDGDELDHTKPKIDIPHGQPENTYVDDDGSVIQVSRYGSIMFPSKHPSTPGGLGHQSSASTDGLLLRIGQNESMMCCGLSIVFVVVVLLGVGWGVKMHRRRREQEAEGGSGDWVEDEKKDFLEV